MEMPSSAAQSNDQILGTVEVNVRRALKPVAAPSAFREHLRDGLIIAAHHQQAHQTLGYLQPVPSPTTWLWFVGAVMIGMGLGFIAMRLRAR